jgi:exosome complex RNA-binding protein Rrp42 (RNase PH superfamily)
MTDPQVDEESGVDSGLTVSTDDEGYIVAMQKVNTEALNWKR